MKLIRFAAALGVLAVSGTAGSAFAGQVEGIPATWRLENYVVGHEVRLWFTGAAGCDNGGIGVSGMTQDDQNRLWSLILTAKATNRPVGIFYNGSGSACTITSFYIP